MSRTKKNLFIVVNVDWFFLSHRLPIALKALRQNYSVTIITNDTGHRKEIEAYGLRFIHIPFERTRVNPLNELTIYRRLKALYKKEKPDIVHHVTLKPIILGSLAAKKVPGIAIVNAVSGLGIVFTGSGSKIKRYLILLILKRAFQIKNPLQVIFQNVEDRTLFLDYKLIASDQCTLIKGSGVDLTIFHYHPPQNLGIIKVLIAARMLYSKGFDEFSQAAAMLTKSGQYPHVVFEMAGDIDRFNPSGISETVLHKWETERNVIWLGHVTDMKSKIAQSDIIVFPSYYGEGVPKFLIEACSIGRPIITTNHPGCRDCVDDRVNGFLVDSKDSEQLAAKMKILLDDSELRKEFGKKSRAKAETEFSIDTVLAETLAIYERLTKEDSMY